MTNQDQTATPLYQLNQLTKTYPKGRGRVTALKAANLSITRGEFLTIQGPTGHGKTTLLMLLGALDRPTSGQLIFDGKDISRAGEGELGRLRAHNLGFVFQSYNLMPTLSAGENVEAALVPLGVPAGERRQRAEAALAEVGLEERVGHFPAELSGGEQQRVAIARALVKNPRVVLADEPTGNLDEETRGEVLGILEKLWSARGLTLIVVTHDTKVAKSAPRTAMISKGELTLRQNFKAPAALSAEPG